MTDAEYKPINILRKDDGYSAAYYEANKERIKAKRMQRYYENREEIAAKEAAKRAQKRLERYGSPDPHKPQFDVPRSDPAYMKLWQEANREIQKVKRRAFYQENRERILASQKEYGERPENKARIIAKVKKWQQDNPDLVAKKNAAWKAENPESVSCNKAKRRSRALSAPGSHTRQESKAILVAQNYTCANPYCQADLNVVKRHLDHIVALTRGGSNWASNLQWLCVTCNTRKHNKPYDEWLEQELLNRKERIAA